jgi:hypothetical protein
MSEQPSQVAVVRVQELFAVPHRENRADLMRLVGLGVVLHGRSHQHDSAQQRLVK